MECGFYDIDVEGFSQIWDSEEIFNLQNLKNRKIFLTGEINEDILYSAVRHILQYNADDKGKDIAQRKPVLIYCASNGGDVDSGFELIDCILQSKTPIYTINLGYCYSMGMLIAIAGHKRYATKNAKYLLHDGSEFIVDSGTKVQDRLEFNRKIAQRMKEYILTQTRISEKEYAANLRKEWYFYADEAKKLGVVDFIIGQDCELDVVV